MKNMKWNLITFIALLLSACTGNGEKADAYGNFQADDMMVSAQATGQIVSMTAEEGGKLKKGEVIGLIDTTTLHLQKKQLMSKIRAIESNAGNIRAQIAVQEQQLENQEKNLKRIKNLYESGAATEKQLEDIEGAVELSKKQLEATHTKLGGIREEINGIKDQIAIVNENISKSYIKNPVEGTVLTKYAREGEFAAAGKPLYKLADLSRLDLKVYVSGDQISEIKLGQSVEVLIDKNKKEYTRLQGEVTWIASNAEFTPKTIQTKEERVNLVYAVKVNVKNDGSLKIGMPGEINF